MNLEHTKALSQFGITLKESERYNTVSSRFGAPVAERELRRNLKSYEREFLMDEAVSLPHSYHIRHGELFSEEAEHDLFNIKKQIDARERNGVTLQGFTAYENLMADAPVDSVSLWYSPDGPSGFEGVTFDSGRLYFGFKNAPDATVNFDIKVRPDFPVISLLGALHEEVSGVRPGFDSPETGKMYYLAHPFTLPTDTNGFFHMMEQYAQGEVNPVYVSRRDTDNMARRSLSSVVEEMQQALVSFSQDAKRDSFDPPGDKTVAALMREEDIMQHYLAVIAPYIEQNKGAVTLYGCSTTSTVSQGDIQRLIGSHSVESLISLYSTGRRLLTRKLPENMNSPKDRYEDYTCPHCSARIQGELKGRPETWKSECPSCHGKLHCAD